MVKQIVNGRNQDKARITGLHQKYETYKALYERIDGLKILFRNGFIKLENLDSFCQFTIEVQNAFSNDFDFIKPYNKIVRWS